MGWTNKGKTRVLEWAYRRTNLPANLYVALVTDAVVPDEDTNTFTELTEITAGNGYTTGGFELTPGATDFDVLNENDADDRGEIQIKDVPWTAATGPIPASGSGARYAVLLDDNATVANREVLHWWDLEEDRSVSDGQTLTLQNLEIRLLTPTP